MINRITSAETEARRAGNFLQLALTEHRGRIGRSRRLLEFAGALRAPRSRHESQFVRAISSELKSGESSDRDEDDDRGRHPGGVISRLPPCAPGVIACRTCLSSVGPRGPCAKLDSYQKRPLCCSDGFSTAIGLFPRLRGRQFWESFRRKQTHFNPSVPEAGLGTDASPRTHRSRLRIHVVCGLRAQ